MSTRKDLNLKALKLYVIHSLLANGFDQAQEEVISVFTEVLSTYIKRIASETKNLALLANKTDPSIFDLFLFLNHINFRLSDISEYVLQDLRSSNLRLPLSPDFFRQNGENQVKNSGGPNVREGKMVKSAKIKKKKGSYNEKNKGVFSLMRESGLGLTSGEKNNNTANAGTKASSKISCYPIFYPPFPEEFTFKESEGRERKLYDEAEIKKIRSGQKREAGEEISALAKEKERIKDEDGEQGPFGAPLKKVKRIELKDFSGV